MHIALETICAAGFAGVVTTTYWINRNLLRLIRYIVEYPQAVDSEKRDDIGQIRSQLSRLTGQMQELLKSEEEKRNILKEKEGESKALLESLIRSVDRLYVDKNKYYGVE